MYYLEEVNVRDEFEEYEFFFFFDVSFNLYLV